MSTDADKEERYLGSRDSFERLVVLIKFGFIVFSSLYGHALLYGSEVYDDVDASALGFRGTMRATKGEIAEQLVIGGVVLCALAMCSVMPAWDLSMQDSGESAEGGAENTSGDGEKKDTRLDAPVGMLSVLVLLLSDTGEVLILSRLVLPDIKGEFSVNNATCTEFSSSPLDVILIVSLGLSLLCHVYARISAIPICVIVVSMIIFASALRESLSFEELMAIALIPPSALFIGMFVVFCIFGDESKGTDANENEVNETLVVLSAHAFGAAGFMALGLLYAFDPEKVCYLNEVFFILAGVLLVQGGAHGVLDYVFPLPDDAPVTTQTTEIINTTQAVQPPEAEVVLPYAKV